MRVLGALAAFILMFVLLAGEVILHLFVGLQLFEVGNKIAAEEFVNRLTQFINIDLVTKYSSYLLKPSIRIGYYVLIFIIIALIFSFNSHFSTSLKETGFATAIASLPYIVVSYAFFFVEKKFPADSAEYFKNAFKLIFRNTSLWALAGGVLLCVIGSILKKIEKKVKDNRKRREKKQRREERKEVWKDRFGRKEKTDEDEPASVETEVVEEEEN